MTAPDSRAGDGVRWGLGDAVGWWIVGFIGGGIASGIVLAVAGADDLDDLSLGWLAIAQLGLWIGLLGGPLVAAKLKGHGPVGDFGLRIRGGDVPLGLLVGFVSQWVIVWVVYLPLQLLTDISTSDISEPAQEMTDRAGDPLGVALLVLIVGIGAPIVEEIFFRGFLQRALVRRIGEPLGVGVAALAFALTHFQWLQLPALFLFGVVLGIVTLRHRRLGPAIVAHMVFNMTAVVSLLVAD
jgi:membrane protease YdiL (CAAX protease family)